MKKVLIALDYDPTAQKVAEKGYALAKSMGAETTLLHVISDPAYYVPRTYTTIMGFTGFVDSGPIPVHDLPAIKLSCQKFLDKSKHHLGDEFIKTLMIKGDVADSILEAAAEIDADIIVIGTHSRKWMENLLMGSAIEKVIRNTKVPLYIIPTRHKK